MIINQPYDNQLGVDLITQLESEKYNSFTVMVAYAKLSGVYRLLPYLKAFKSRNGKLRCIVGIDQQNTTYDALVHLNSVMDELYIFHSESFTQTFHVKSYWLSGNDHLWYAIGSNNLTAGGLFSNYEMSVTNHLNGDNTILQIQKLNDIFNSYTNTASTCCQKVDTAFINQLLEYGYVIKELQLRKALIKSKSTSEANDSKSKPSLFGKEVFSAPSLSAEYKTSKSSSATPPKPTDTAATPQITLPKQLSVEKITTAEKDYLIRFIPGASNRSKQVHFTIDLLKNYFMLEPGDSILLQEMYPSGEVNTLEHRQIVFSHANSNVKIEIKGAGILNTNYPKDLEKRPILVVKRINANLFAYMLLMSGDDGYDNINSHLKALPKGRSLQYEVIDENTIFTLWDNCPLT